jgi:hypothetical protein
VIGKVCRRGADVRRLLGYLFLEGEAGERGLASDHIDAHVVAGYAPADALQPPRRADGRLDVTTLAALLHAPVAAGGVGRNAKPVYHLAISAAKSDRLLSDAEWADIAVEYVDRIGLAPRSDDAAVRWVAVRHAPDHVHVVATLVRQDGRRVFPRQDYLRSREASRAVEARYGLTTTAPVGGTSTLETTRAEWRKHAEESRRRGAQGRPAPAGPDREVLRARVRVALAGSRSWEEFTERLRLDGVLVRPRYSTVNPGEITGYAVSLLPALRDVADGATPLWFSGGKLAPDLTLPRLRRRWTDPDGSGRAEQQHSHWARSEARSAGRRGRLPRLTDFERAQVWAAAAAALRDARAAVDAAAAAGRSLDEDPEALAAAMAASDVLHTASRLVEGKRGGPLYDAAEHYDHASRPPRRHNVTATATSRALRGAARGMLTARLVQRQDLRQLLRLMEQLAALAETVARLRETQEQGARARAALLAAQQLNAKIRMLQTHPLWGGVPGPVTVPPRDVVRDLNLRLWPPTVHTPGRPPPGTATGPSRSR